MIKAILFDLDGTLLPMDQDRFTGGYFGFLTKKLAPRGYEPKALIDGIWAGTAAMVKNDGSVSNEDAFWRKFAEIFGESALADRPLFEEFYRVDFQQARQFCGFDPAAAETVRLVKELGFRTALATNPIFPSFATESRIRWTGLEPEDFEFFTSYETIGCCKPNPAYFTEVAKRMALPPEECLMVGNDAKEDTAALDAGMRVFLLTDCLINKDGRPLDPYPHGDFNALQAFIRGLHS